jgi:hypothetical protein
MSATVTVYNDWVLLVSHFHTDLANDTSVPPTWSLNLISFSVSNTEEKEDTKESVVVMRV